MNRRPGEGERRAISGYKPQYLVGAELVKRGLANRDLEWLRVADPEAGRVDDLQLAHAARIDAYQVKWKQYGGNISFNELIKGNQEEPALIAQLADGWQRLTELYPTRRIRVHLVTNASPSPTAKLPEPKTASKPRPYHPAAFIEQEWYPKRRSQTIDLTGEWEAVWESLCQATNLSIEEFQAFVFDCHLDFNTQRPEENDDINAIVNLLLSKRTALCDKPANKEGIEGIND